MKTIDDLLIKLDACDSLQEWARGKSWGEIFKTCTRGDWLLWLWENTAIDNEENHKLMIRAKAHCILTLKHLRNYKRSINACEVALKFVDGLATKEEFITATDAASNGYPSSNIYAAVNKSYIKFPQETADICRKHLPIELWNI